jgi:AraC-like DNA-binding protein
MYGRNGYHPTVVKLLALLDRHDPIARGRVTDVAARLNISVSHLQHLIKRDLGVSYTTLVRARRVLFARRMMREHPEWTISDIASRCGYEVGQLYRHFMLELSVPPSDVRKQDALTSEPSRTATSSDRQPIRRVQRL